MKSSETDPLHTERCTKCRHIKLLHTPARGETSTKCKAIRNGKHELCECQLFVK